MTTHQIKIYDALSTVQCVAPNLWVVDGCFDDATYQWLAGIVDTPGNRFTALELKKRLQLTRSADQARLNQIGQQQAASLSRLVDCGLAFMQAKFWLDLPQFGCQPHRDAPELYVNYQVYIAASPGADVACVGAEFLHVDPPCQIALKPNYGYINVNCDLKLHRVHGGHGTRTSVMFQYARQ